MYFNNTYSCNNNVDKKQFLKNNVLINVENLYKGIVSQINNKENTNDHCLSKPHLPIEEITFE